MGYVSMSVTCDVSVRSAIGFTQMGFISWEMRVEVDS